MSSSHEGSAQQEQVNAETQVTQPETQTSQDPPSSTSISQSQSQPQSEPSNSQSQPQCQTCRTPQQSAEKPLKPCSKCQSTLYCNKECVKADFKQHKKVCARLAQEYFSKNEVKMESSSRNAGRAHRDRGLQKWQFDT